MWVEKFKLFRETGDSGFKGMPEGGASLKKPALVIWLCSDKVSRKEIEKEPREFLRV